MKPSPAVVAFDVVETIFSLENLRLKLVAAGLAPHLLETWFATLIRDAFALDATGVYRPFREVATASLEALFVEPGPGQAQIDRIIDGFAELDAHPDVEPAMRHVRNKGARVVALTNGNAGVTDRLLVRAGLRDLVERIISIDEVQHWKPKPEVYRHCANVVGVEPRRVALVAVHPWDCQGAGRAGLMTGYVGRDGKIFPPTMDPPDAVARSLVEVVEKLLADR